MLRAVLVLTLCAAPARAMPEEGWDAARTMHFTVKRQSRLMDKKFQATLERAYQRLHTELFSLSPWMATEKVEVFVYRDRRAYAAGSFRPPEWSGGAAVLDPDPKVAKRLILFKPVPDATVAHELTHLYFDSFFREAGKQPPRWLNEGLATMLEDEVLRRPDPRNRGPRLKEVIPLERFFASEPGRDDPRNRVLDWYAQAHSLVRFLKRRYNKFRFVNFCKMLRAGDGEAKALRQAFGLKDYAELEREWLKWISALDLPQDRK